MRSKSFVSGTLLLAAAGTLGAQYARPKITNGVTIEQKLNAPIPLDLVFHDERGQTVPLWKYFRDKPVVLSLVYFNCPSLCPMSLHETVTSLRRVALEPGRDYNVVVVSFDPKDTPREAALTKTKYKAQFGDRAGYDAGWHFLTGDQQSISKLADAVGFRYRWDDRTRQFIHAGGIMVATPDGKVSRYFYGIDYAPADVRMALVDASHHKIGSPVDYVLLFCFHYDATQGKYTLAIVNVLKIAGALTLLVLAGLLYFLMRDDKNKKTRRAWKDAHHVG
ncbi:MAG: SCO family protein [Acidobacteriota bacterium]|nr:SCO family protein [Acidobacteriota bacterium]